MDIGVDLNRNYSYRFKYDEQGSSSDLCDQSYRGPYAFSEPETKAMRDLVLNLQNTKIALNLHAYGLPAPLWIHPFCYTTDKSNKPLKEGFPDARKFYTEVAREMELRGDAAFLVGNAIDTIEYTANGEASDWMLGQLGIYAVSVELGGSKASEQSFFISNAATLRDLVIQNDRWIHQMLHYLQPDFSCELEAPSRVISQNPADPATVKTLTAYICENRAKVGTIASSTDYFL